MIKYKINIIEALKKKGFTTYKIRKENLLSQSTITKLNNNDTTLSLVNIDTICTLLDCDISEILTWEKT